MKWTYSIQNKLTAAAALFILCLLVLLSIYNNRVHNQEVKYMIGTLYQDRIMAEVYILRFSDNLYKIREELERKHATPEAANHAINVLLASIDSACTAYANTKLTAEETSKFQAFRKIIEKLSRAENQDVYKGFPLTSEALALLPVLSAIQVNESKLIVKHSEKQYRNSRLSTDFAWAVAIIILVVLQALVFSSKTFYMSNKQGDARLN